MAENIDTETVKLIRGDPKKALLKLSWPMIISMLLMSANNIIDSIWVAGLGSEPLAALGFVTPLFLILVGIGNGLGAGANSLISRRIGEKKHYEANNAAYHSLVITLIITIILTVVFLVFLKPILIAMGGKDVLSYAMSYGSIIVLGTFTLTLPALYGSILRAEGDVKRATIPLAVTAILNMILDPIFIYVLGLGVAGAATATVLTGFIGLVILIYWTMIKKDCYVSLERKYFRQDKEIYKNILLVGIPASVEQLIMSITAMILNGMLTVVGGTVSVAVYTAGWRLVQIGIMPAIGIGTAAITVAGVAYGEKNYEKLKTTLNYSVKIGFITAMIVAIIFFVFSDQLAYLFSYSSSSANLAPLISDFLKIMCLYILPVCFGVSASSVLQALGKGTQSLILTANRSLILDVIFAAIAAFILYAGSTGIYWGIVLGDIVGSILAYIYCRDYLRRLNNLGIFKDSPKNVDNKVEDVNQ
jgi:putative MATE family efflux protein